MDTSKSDGRGLTKVAKEEIKALQLDIKQVTRGYSILNENQVQKLFNSTPRRWQFKRPARGGGEWRHVKKGYVRKQLDSIFGFNHSFETKTPVLDALEVAEKTGSVVVEGRLTCVVLDNRGQEIAKLVKDDYGGALVKFTTDKKTGQKKLLDFANDVKAARSDCFKRTAAALGVAADIYEKDEFFEIEIVGAEEVSDRRKETEKKIAEARKTLKKQGIKVDK